MVGFATPALNAHSVDLLAPFASSAAYQYYYDDYYYYYCCCCYCCCYYYYRAHGFLFWGLKFRV